MFRWPAPQTPGPCGSHTHGPPPPVCSAQTLAAKGIALLPSNASLSHFPQPPLSIISTSGRKYSDRNHGRRTGHQHCPHQLAESRLVHPIPDFWLLACTISRRAPHAPPEPRTLSLADCLADATLRNAAEQQLTHAAETNFVSPPVTCHFSLLCVPVSLADIIRPPSPTTSSHSSKRWQMIAPKVTSEPPLVLP